MQAALLDGYGQSLRVTEVPDPIPDDHEVVIRVMAVGLCHTDLHLIDGQPAILPGFPAILGHESAGVIESCGAAVTDWQIGAHVAVFGAQGCGACSRCTQDLENLCQEQTLSMNGIGRAGGFAQLMTVDARHLVDCGGLDSTEAAVLTDAGLTSYRAVMRAIGLRPDPRPQGLGQDVREILGRGGRLGHVRALRSGLRRLPGSSAAAKARQSHACAAPIAGRSRPP